MKKPLTKLFGVLTMALAAWYSPEVKAQSSEGDTGQIEEVTINALGLTQSSRSIAYGNSQIKGRAIETSGESGLIQAMSGKASNVQITRNTGDPGSGAYIQIRGQNTISGSNQPLIVVDGVPISNSSIGGGVDGVVQQSRLNDINPADIADIQVLKGAAAAAVWGTRAANGVILITTKKGRKGMSVDFTTSMAFDQVNREYEKQTTYGQGVNGTWRANNALSWGDVIADRSGTDDVNDQGAYFEGGVTGKKYYPILAKGDNTVYNDANRAQVFRTGVTYNNNISINSANDRSSVYFSASDWNQTGVLAGNSDYRRSTARLNFNYKVDDKLSVGMNTTLAKITSNRVQMGSNLNGLYLGYLRTPADFDNTDYFGTYYNAAGVGSLAHRGYRRYLGDAAPTYNNPGWTLNRQVNTSDVTRIIFNPEAQYKWRENHTLIGRVGYDMSTDRRLTFFPYRSGGSQANGAFSDNMIQESEYTFHALDQSSHDFGSIKMNATVGYLYSNRNFYSLGGSGQNFINTDQDRFNFNNFTSENMTPSNSVSQVLSDRVYGVFDFVSNDKLFLNLAMASEATSTFDGRFSSPSVGLGYEFYKDLSVPALSYGKLRASWGQVGVAPPAYIWGTNYVSGGSTSGWGEYMDASFYGGSLVRSTAQGNPDIKPEIKREMEFGADLKFMDNKVSLSATYYSNEITGGILAVAVPASSGYTNQWKNVATITNKGLELDWNINLVNNDNLKWNLYGNFGANRNMVVDLAGVESIFLAGFTGSSSRAVAGYAMGALWSGRWERDAEGNLVLDANGFPTVAATEGVVGDPNPNWRGGFGTNLSAKGLTLNVLFEACQGNDMWAGTLGVLNYFGTSAESGNTLNLTADQAASLKNVYGDAVADVVAANADGSYTVRGNIKNFGGGDVWLDQNWYTGIGGGFGPVGEQFMKDASWVRLRELSLGYQLPEGLCRALHVPGASLNFSGRNLLLWTNFDGLDPETNLTGVTNGRGLDYFNNPGTKSYVFTLNIKL